MPSAGTSVLNPESTVLELVLIAPSPLPMILESELLPMLPLLLPLFSIGVRLLNLLAVFVEGVLFNPLIPLFIPFCSKDLLEPLELVLCTLTDFLFPLKAHVEAFQFGIQLWWRYSPEMSLLLKCSWYMISI